MQINKNTNDNYTARQLKLPLEIKKLIVISDPVYTFCEVMDHIDLLIWKRRIWIYFLQEFLKIGNGLRRCSNCIV